MQVRALEITRPVNDPIRSFDRLVSSCRPFLPVSGQKKSKGSFLLLTASSRVSDLPGISAAGHDAEARRLTPAVDAEALLSGRTISADSLPVSPRGIVSPVVISRACLGLLDMPVKIVDCGSFHSPAVECQRLAGLVADCVSSGAALPLSHCYMLFQAGLKIGENLSAYNDYLIVAECVPGGTTTALAVLCALGHEANGFMSSSLPSCNHEQRRLIVEQGLSRSPYSRDLMLAEPLRAVSSVGDPMQAVAAGICVSATAKIPVYLGGGSQMLAVWSLIRALAAAGQAKANYRELMIITTGWVAFDNGAKVGKLASMLAAPLAAACPDFRLSKHDGLRAYEEGNVKEGVGAGACMAFADMASFSQAEIINAIDTAYDQMLGK